MNKIIAVIFMLTLVHAVYGFSSGSPVCEVSESYENISSHNNASYNLNAGPYQLSANVNAYNTFEPVEITLSGGAFSGLLFTVVDEQGNSVGSFSPDTQVRACGLKAMAVTHSNAAELVSKTLFWIPPEAPVGSIYIIGYVYTGTDGPNFYRLVRSDNTALKLTLSDVIFLNDFE